MFPYSYRQCRPGLIRYFYSNACQKSFFASNLMIWHLRLPMAGALYVRDGDGSVRVSAFPT